jgi:hypothetical protein
MNWVSKYIVVVLRLISSKAEYRLSNFDRVLGTVLNHSVEK